MHFGAMLAREWERERAAPDSAVQLEQLCPALRDLEGPDEEIGIPGKPHLRVFEFRGERFIRMVAPCQVPCKDPFDFDSSLDPARQLKAKLAAAARFHLALERHLQKADSADPFLVRCAGARVDVGRGEFWLALAFRELGDLATAWMPQTDGEQPASICAAPASEAASEAASAEGGTVRERGPELVDCATEEAGWPPARTPRGREWVLRHGGSAIEQMSTALEFLHEQLGYTHNDIDLSNFLLSGGGARVELNDFEGTLRHGEAPNRDIGIPYRPASLAPELKEWMLDPNWNPPLTHASDVFALGTALKRLLWDDQGDALLLPEFAALLERMCADRPHERPGMPQVLATVQALNTDENNVEMRRSRLAELDKEREW